jgi:hypothetical protein
MSAKTSRPDWFTRLGIGIGAAGAALASMDALAHLAYATGWSPWVAWLLPLGVDWLAAVALRVWWDESAPDAARRFGRTAALGAIAASMAGNAAAHLIATGDVAVGVPLIVVVGAAPAVVFAAIAHLHALRTAPVPSKTRKARPASQPANESVAESANPSAPQTANPVPLPGRDRSSRTTDRPKSTNTARKSAAQYADMAVAKWREQQPAGPVTAKWIKDNTGCSKTTSHNIVAEVRKRVGVVLQTAS